MYNSNQPPMTPYFLIHQLPVTPIFNIVQLPVTPFFNLDRHIPVKFRVKYPPRGFHCIVIVTFLSFHK